MLESCGWGGVVGGPCDYCVSPSPFSLDFGTLDFGTSDSGLTISENIYFNIYLVDIVDYCHRKEGICPILVVKSQIQCKNSRYMIISQIIAPR